MTENEVARETVDAAYRIHSVLGPGLLESVYEVVLAGEPRKRGLRAATQQPIPVVYEGTRFDMGFRADLLLEDNVIVEIKSVAEIVAVRMGEIQTVVHLQHIRKPPLQVAEDQAADDERCDGE
jgi:GxxExxY protein